MLRVSDLHIRYGSITAVRGLSFEVGEGEAVGLIGANGAGKSSTLKAIAGLLQPTDGNIELEGERIDGLGPDTIVRRGVALVPEGRQIFGTLTVKENLRVGRAVRRRDPDLSRDLEEILDLFPILREFYSSPAGKLSGGEQQQLAIARALILKPRLLLLDEPSLGLAPQLVSLVFDVLEKLRQNGVTILLVEQVVARTVAFADRTYILRNGRIVASGSREELQSRRDMAELYVGVTQ
jgi:branched-chain amino acid transport system ATP-binding protein